MRKPALFALLFLACNDPESSMENVPDNSFVAEHKGRFEKLATTNRVPPNATLGARGDWLKVLNAQVPDEFASPVTINLRSEYEIVQGPAVSGGPTIAPGAPLVGQPLVARIRWGTHGAYNIIDLDIPPPHTGFEVPAGFPASAPVDDIGTGLTITLAGSAFEVLVRNDANLSYLVAPGASSLAAEPQAAKVLATLTPGQGPGRGRLARTIYVAGNGNSLAVGATVFVRVPAFAQRAWFMREPDATTPLAVGMLDTSLLALYTQNVPVNSPGPIELHPNVAVLDIFNNGAVAVNNFQVMFEVNPQ